MPDRIDAIVFAAQRFLAWLNDPVINPSIAQVSRIIDELTSARVGACLPMILTFF